MRFVALLCVLFFSFWAQAQSFLSTNGKEIVNEQGESVLLRGMGLGGWMVQEGYMLQTASFANPQHKIKEKIQDLVGEEVTNDFYNAWLENHVTKEDIDSLKAWGFNSVRLPMHYNLFTLPIEKEPVEGENTWLSKGFELTDSLISWCAQNEMYVILDMHATPGGQGYDEGISDYDPTKPSLWESSLNQEKLASLWKQLAIRYVDEKWVAGYDLINETNWNLPGGTLLRSVYERITDSIRTVDQDHILFIEGNWFANDFTGLTPPWDDEIVYSPHKYWSTNDQASIQWVLDLRETHNVPLYLGESGENSNQWFRDAISLLESHNIGWAWWPMKKVEAIAGPLSANKTFSYQSLLNFWEGTGAEPTQENATFALMQLADNFKMQKCTFEPGVIDAMFRQVQSDETVPYASLKIPGTIPAVYYDMGSLNTAYYDNDAATYHVSTGTYTAWNNGWTMRNDGVDIEPSMDSESIVDYNVGWLNEGEWMKYSLKDVEEGVYTVNVRTAGGDFGGKFHFSTDGASISDTPFVPFSGGYQTWQTTSIADVVIYNDMDHFIFHVDGEGFNLGQYEFVKTGEISEVTTKFVAGSVDSSTVVSVNMNKYLDGNTSNLSATDFSIFISGAIYTPINAWFNSENARFIELEVDKEMVFTDEVKVSYFGTSIFSTDGDPLETFALKEVQNNLPTFFIIPTRIQAEEYVFQEGIELENTTDTGGGQNIGYLDVGDYCEYDVFIPAGGQYRVLYRNASDGGSGGIRMSLFDDNGQETIIETVTFSSTGGWQNWETKESNVVLPSGRYTMRLTITQPLFNLNWVEFDLVSSVQEAAQGFKIYPNPAQSFIQYDFPQKESITSYEIVDASGAVVVSGLHRNHEIRTDFLRSGFYVLKLKDDTGKIYLASFIKL